MTKNSISRTDSDKKVIRLRTRSDVSRQRPDWQGWHPSGETNIVPFSRFTRSKSGVQRRQQRRIGLLQESIINECAIGDDSDDYSRRMLENVLAIGVLFALMAAGLWVANTLAHVS